MGEIPTDEQLRRIERGVLDTIDRRTVRRARIRTGAITVVVAAGLIFSGSLLFHSGASGASTAASGTSGGSSAGDRFESGSEKSVDSGAASGGAAPEAAPAGPKVECYPGATTDGTAVAVQVPATSSDSTVTAACAAALRRAAVTATSASRALVVCVDSSGDRTVFTRPDDATTTASALCAANGLYSR